MRNEQIGTGRYEDPPDWLEMNVHGELERRREARAEAHRRERGEGKDERFQRWHEGVVPMNLEFIVPHSAGSLGEALRYEHRDLPVLSDLELESEGFCARMALCFGDFFLDSQREWVESRVEACRAELESRRKIVRIGKELR